MNIKTNAKRFMVVYNAVGDKPAEVDLFTGYQLDSLLTGKDFDKLNINGIYPVGSKYQPDQIRDARILFAEVPQVA